MRIVALCLILAAAPRAQQFPTSQWNVKDHEVSLVVAAPKGAPAVTGAPYSADQIQDYTPPPGEQRMAPRSSLIGRFARDTQGRSRMERAYKPAPIWLTEIFDPVAGVAWLLEGEPKIAHRMPWNTIPTSPPAVNPQMTMEKLGTSVIEGVSAEGTRMVHGSLLAIENWDSPQLKVTLLSKSSNGYSSRLTNLKLGEPGAELFRPPSDYRVIDEKEPFPITIHFQ